MKCNGCPRGCNAERPNGFCRMPQKARVARAALHFFEEPCISGKNGSGTVFFCGCNLRCAFCQNAEISRGDYADYEEFTAGELTDVYSKLIEAGAENINLVTPSHYTDVIAQSLEKKPSVPVCYNSSGYDSIDSLKTLKSRIDIYMPDMKYANSSLAQKYSKAMNYPDIAIAAIEEMYRQVGKCVFDSNRMLKKGIIIRHLILPGEVENSKAVIDMLYDTVPRKNVIVSLMGQYTPPEDEEFAAEYPSLTRKITQEEYDEVKAYLFKKGFFNCYTQSLESCDGKFIPDFGKDFII